MDDGVPALHRPSAPIGSQIGLDRLLALVTAVERLSAAARLNEIIAIVRDSARTISGAQGVTFVLRDGDRCHYVAENAISPLWTGRRFPMTACISGWCMLNGATAVIPDIYADPRIPHDAYRPTFVKSLVMTPVRAEAPLAAIGSYLSVCRDFGYDEVALLETLARSTAAAIAAVQAKERLQESEARLQHALQAGSLGAWELDRKTGELAATALCRTHLGWPAQASLSAGDLAAALHAEDRPLLAAALDRTHTHGAPLSLEVRAGAADDPRWIELRGRAQRDANEEVARLAGVCADVTEARRTRERLDSLHDELARVGRIAEIDHLSSALAHELRQPLSAARTYLGAARQLLAASGPAGASVEGLVGKADGQLVRTDQIIQRIGGFIGPNEATRAPTPIAELLDEVVEIAATNPLAKGVDLRIELAPDLPAALVDRVQIQQVLLNLLRNAFQAMAGRPRRAVRISARPATDKALLELRVQDSGPGLAPEVAARLFKPFVTTKSDGMGVGLSISRRIVTAHGGDIWADEAATDGAAFCLTVPRADCASPGGSPPRP